MRTNNVSCFCTALWQHFSLGMLAVNGLTKLIKVYAVKITASRVSWFWCSTRPSANEGENQPGLTATSATAISTHECFTDKSIMLSVPADYCCNFFQIWRLFNLITIFAQSSWDKLPTVTQSYFFLYPKKGHLHFPIMPICRVPQ